MATEKDNSNSWKDDVRDLILKKQAENLALRKIQESLQSKRATGLPAGGEDEHDDQVPDEESGHADDLQQSE